VTPAASEGLALMLSAADSKSDRVVRFLAEDGQLVPAIARQARRSTRRFGARIEPVTLSHLRWTASPGEELARLTEAGIEAPFAVIKADVLRLAMASLMAEVVLALLPDFAREEHLFELLLRAWRRLDDPARRPAEEVLLLFELRVLTAQGVMPPLEDLPGVSDVARDTLRAWSEGQWRGLEPGDRRQVAAALEARVCEVSGRRTLRSRGVLDQLLAG